MDSIKDSIRDPKTIVIDSIQLRSAEDRPYVDNKGNPYTGNNKLNDREPILETVNIRNKSGESVNKSELKIGDKSKNSTGIVTAYLKNNLVEVSDDQITIKNGSNPPYKIYLKDNDLHINDTFVLDPSGKVKKMLINDSMIYNSANTDNYVDGQLLFIEDVSATTSGS